MRHGRSRSMGHGIVRVPTLGGSPLSRLRPRSCALRIMKASANLRAAKLPGTLRACRWLAVNSPRTHLVVAIGARRMACANARRRRPARRSRSRRCGWLCGAASRMCTSRTSPTPQGCPRGRLTRTQHAAQQSLAAAIAERVGTDLDADMFPAVMAGAVSAAIQVAHERWLRSDPPVALATLIRQALAQLRSPLAADHADSEFSCRRPAATPILAQAPGQPAGTHHPSTPSE
jgi:hypothetical protein